MFKEQKEGHVAGAEGVREENRISERQKLRVKVKEHGFCSNVMGSRWQILSRGDKGSDLK